MEIRLLEQNIEDAFMSMVDRKEFDEALEFIDSCINKIPHSKALNYIIFRIIMDKDCDKKNAIAAGMYLQKILSNYQPSDYSRRYYYKGALTSEKNLSHNLWATFRHFVESSFCHHKIYRAEEDEDDNQIKPVQYPHCDILIDFYVKVLLDSYECMSSERAFYEGKEKSLVAELFWPSLDSELSAAKENPRQFLGWIRSIYEHSARIQKVSVFKTLHKLFNLMVKCIVTNAHHGNAAYNDLPDSLICSSVCLLDIVRNIMHNIPVAFDSHENVRRFMNHISLKYLSLKLCEYTVFELIHSRQPSERNSSPTTLKKIVNVYMFNKKQHRRGRPKKQAVNEIKDKAPKMQLKVNKKGDLVRSYSGDTILHEACRLDKCADLYENISSTPALDVNARNSVGQTPLHVACVAKTFLCAKILIDECGAEHSKQKLDWTATDADGFTPLHAAIQRDACDIAKMILKKGGSKAFCVSDNQGQKPNAYASSKEMEKLLKEFAHLCAVPGPSTEDSSVDTIFNCNIPTLDNFKKYALFFHTLHFLLAYYSDIYHLYEISNLMGKSPNLIQISKHEDKTCPHFIPWIENSVCSLDFEYLKQLSAIVNHFIKSATEHSKEKKLNLDLELLPLKMYVAALNT